jgi:polyhydroxybutyrate depolymerase
MLVCSALAGAAVSDAASAATLGDSTTRRDAIASAGCGTSAVRSGETNVATTSGGVERTYIRHVPPAHDGTKPLPLLVALHGLGEGPLHRQMTEWGPRADAHGFVVVYPQAIGGAWDLSFAGADVAFIGHLLDEAGSTLCIDTNRIYVSGLSYGAFMTSTIACVYADRVAAVAPVAGIHAPDDCSPARPVPVLTFHGTDDNWVDYERFQIENNVAAWAQRNGCPTSPRSTSVPGDDVVSITRIEYPCPPHAEVQFYRITNGGHAWPGSEFSRSIAAAVGYTTFAINASDLIWEFFESHQLREGQNLGQCISSQIRAALGLARSRTMGLRVPDGASFEPDERGRAACDELLDGRRHQLLALIRHAIENRS